VLKYVTPELTLEFGPAGIDFPKEPTEDEEDDIAFAHVAG
jgi:hypothetical protein